MCARVNSIRRGRHTHHHQQPDSPVAALARGAGGSDPMQEEITTPTLGTVQVRVCSRCSGRNGKTMRRSHTYVEYRTWRQSDRFWECMAFRDLWRAGGGWG